MKRNQTFVVMLLLAILFSACSNEPANREEPPKQRETPPVQDEHIPPLAPYTAPFTGLGVKKEPGHRPVMVMINNHPKARPQSGLQYADLVYEILAEGELTRFVAIYQSQQPDVIGPVRSIRPYYIDIGAGFDAVMFHAGGSPDALARLSHSSYDYVNEIYNSAYFWRDHSRKAPHNLYTRFSLIDRAMQDKGMRMQTELPRFTFLPQGSVVTGEKATHVEVTYHPRNHASYTYDPVSQQYLRFTDGEPHLDATTKEQLRCTNLVVISAKHRVLDREGRRSVDTAGPGEGVMFRQGTAQKIWWKNSGGIIRFYADEAMTKEEPFLPGNTWINVIPASPGISQGVKYS